MSTSTLPENLRQLRPKRSAWSKGPPLSSRSQSLPTSGTPTPPTHSRRPKALGQGIPVKDGVGLPRHVGATKQGAAVSFGSIDDVNAPISSSPASTPTPPIKSEGVKSFGTMPATVSQVNGKSAVQTSAKPAGCTVTKIGKVDIAKLFQGSSTALTLAPSQPFSPSVWSTVAVQPPSSHTPPASSSPYQQFVPQNGMRQPPPSAGPNVAQSGPNSPQYQHAIPTNAALQMSSSLLGSPQMGSPRSSSPPPLSNMPPPQVPPPKQAWGQYYYPAPMEGQPYAAYGWYMPQPAQVPPEQGLPGPHIPSHDRMPVSPENAVMSIEGTGTSTPPHAPPAPLDTPPSSDNVSSVVSPPAIPSTTTNRRAAYNPNASSFVPRTKISLKKADGTEVNLEDLKHYRPAYLSGTSLPSMTANTSRRSTRRTETEEGRKRRLEAMREKKLAKLKVKQDLEDKVRKEQEEQERKEREEEKEATEKKRIEAERLEDERRKKEEEEREDDRLMSLKKADDTVVNLANFKHRRTQRSNIVTPFPSALATARIIHDLGNVPYPEGVQRPSAELNMGVKDNKFRYDREFLLQFMSICKEKPDMLALDAIGLEPSEGSLPMSRGGSGRLRQTSNASPQRHTSVSGLPPGSFGKASSYPFSMGLGNFGTAGSKADECLDGLGTQVTNMSVAEAKEKITQYSKEFFATRDFEVAGLYFVELPAVHHYLLVDDLVYSSVESSEVGAQLVGDFFADAASKGLCSQAAFEEGIAPTAEFLDDIALDAPGAPDLLAIMMKGAGLTDVRRERIASKSQEYCSKLLELSKPHRLPSSVRTDTALDKISHARLAHGREREAKVKKESYQRQMTTPPRGGSRRGGDRGDQQQVGRDGWTTSRSARRAPPKAGGLSKFGQICMASSAPLIFGPQSSIYANKKDKSESIQRTSSSSQDMFSMLQNSEASAAQKEYTQREKLVLAPRYKPMQSTTAEL